MIIKNNNLLSEDTPLIFADGTATYKKLAETYSVHNEGYFILAPSGAGKTYFIENQSKKDWIDGDTLWMTTNAHPKGEWWLKPLSAINEIERRSDVITTEAKKQGFWVIGTDCYSILPDAVVIPDWETHKSYIEARQHDNYDGGATSNRLDAVLKSRAYIESFTQKGVPAFKSVDEATAFLASQQ